MKPTELYFEPVLIGSATLFVAAMMGLPTLESWLLHADAGKLAAAIVASYFVGIVVDRIADAILHPLNHHHRLRFALNELRRRSPDDKRDPFPEDVYHIATLKSERGSEYVYYLRSRIRLMRAMVVLAPGFGVGVALRLSGASIRMHRVAIGVVCTMYVLAIIVRCRESTTATAARLRDGRIAGLAPPRTDGLLDSTVLGWYQKRFRPEEPLWKFAMLNEPLSPAVLFLAVFSGFIAAVNVSLVTGALAAASTLFVTGTLAWCWWRITATFYTFLRDFSRPALEQSGQVRV